MSRRKPAVRAPARKPTPEPAQVPDALPPVVDFQVSGEVRDFLAPASGHIDDMGIRITESLVADRVERSPEAARIVGLLETDPGLRKSVAAYMVTMSEFKKFTEARGGKWDPVIRAPGEPTLDPLWLSRLSTMATAAGKTPTAYLETLLRRAWCSMPLGKRGGL